MARVTHVKKAQQRYETKPVIDPETGQQKVTPVLRRNGEPKMTKGKNGNPGRPITMRVTEADKTRPKPNRKCEKCGVEIEVGDPYKHISPKSGPYGGRKRVRCAACPSWRPSETTSSQHLSTLYAAQEAADDALGAWEPEEGIDGLQQILNDLAEGVREAGQGYAESADNMEDGFGHETQMSEEIREKADALEQAADDVESAGDDLEEFDEDAATQEAEDEVDEVDEDEIRAEVEAQFEGSDESAEDIEEAVDAAIKAAHVDRETEVETAIDEKRNEWADEQRSKVEDAMQVDF